MINLFKFTITTFGVIIIFISSLFEKDSSEFMDQPSMENGTVCKIIDHESTNYLIHLEDGSTLNPIEMRDNDFRFREGQKVKINYTKLSDVPNSVIDMVKVEHIEEID